MSPLRMRAKDNSIPTPGQIRVWYHDDKPIGPVRLVRPFRGDPQPVVWRCEHLWVEDDREYFFVGCGDMGPPLEEMEVLAWVAKKP